MGLALLLDAIRQAPRSRVGTHSRGDPLLARLRKSCHNPSLSSAGVAGRALDTGCAHARA